MGALAGNVLHFARVLRAAGIPIGTDKVMDAIRALPLAGVEHRGDWRTTLGALFLTRHEQQALFDAAFERFWRDPALEERMRAALLPQVRGLADRSQAPGRLERALHPHESTSGPNETTEITVDAALTYSREERLRHLDFEKMTPEEWQQARALVARLRLPVADVATRRYRAARCNGTLDLRGSLRNMLRQGGDIVEVTRRARRTRPPPLVVLCDVSGSMHRYTRMFLHFLHALTRDRPRLNHSTAGCMRVSTFVFATRLTHVTRALRDRDVDEALAKVGREVQDWAGGTRIGECLKEFNHRWARRVLAQNASVVLLTDGLDRDDAATLAAQMDRLHRSCRKLLWLNPLLRFEEFEPRAEGVAAMLPRVDAFLPMHNLSSLEDLSHRLGRHPGRRYCDDGPGPNALRAI